MMKRNNFLMNLLTKNFKWKVLSLVFAISLWFVVMNIINPTETRTYSVNLTLLNTSKLADNDLVLMNKKELENQRINIKVKAVRPALDELNKMRAGIVASVDMQQFDVLYAKDITDAFMMSVKPTLPINYRYSYEVVDFSPEQISVKLDNLVSVEKKITANVIGSVERDYIVSNPVLSQDTVTLSGAKSVIDTVDKVVVDIDVNKAISNIYKEVNPVVYDLNGNVLENVTLSKDIIGVNVYINKHGQIPINIPTTIGEVAEGYVLEGVEIYPNFIEVVGSDEEIKKLSSITLPHINISDLKQNKTLNFDIRPYLTDRNLTIKSGTSEAVSVTVKVARQDTKVFEVNTEDIEIKNLQEGYNVEFVSSFLPISAVGSIHSAEEVVAEIKPFIDLSVITEGEYTVNVQYEESEKLKVENTPYIKIKVTDLLKTTEAQTQTTTDILTETTTQPEQ